MTTILKILVLSNNFFRKVIISNEILVYIVVIAEQCYSTIVLIISLSR